jgi:putative transposase
METEHRKTLRRFEQFRHLHELTFSCYRRKPLLTNNSWRNSLARSLDLACEAECFALVAFVFMPEHVHLLVCPAAAEAKVSRLLARIKQPVSKQIRQSLQAVQSSLLNQLTVLERPGKTCFRFWQEGAGFDRNLFSATAIAASIDYIHANPVKRGLCQRATDFLWSSARFHELGIVDQQLPKLIRPDPEWFHHAGIQTEFA